MPKIRVFIADDHAVLRTGLRLLINTQQDMEVVGEAGTFGETMDEIAKLKPEVATIDLTMPGGTGVRLIESLTNATPQTRLLVLTMHDDPAYFRLAMAAGAAGYVMKKSADTELLTAIRTVAGGRSFAQVDLAAAVVSRPLTQKDGEGKRAVLDQLSEREKEVFNLVVKGHTNQAIADKLLLSVKTVESYRARLMSKLGLKNRAELTQLALDLGLLGSE